MRKAASASAAGQSPLSILPVISNYVPYPWAPALAADASMRLPPQVLQAQSSLPFLTAISNSLETQALVRDSSRLKHEDASISSTGPDVTASSF